MTRCALTFNMLVVEVNFDDNFDGPVGILGVVFVSCYAAVGIEGALEQGLIRSRLLVIR